VLRKHLLFVLLAPLPAVAGRPFVTDAAALTTAGACQIESWTQHADSLIEYWTLPACNPGGNFEWTVGATRFQPTGQEWETRLLIQGKTLFKALKPGSYGIGIAFGGLVAVGPSAAEEWLTNLYAYVPVSVSAFHDQVVLHANLGWSQDRHLDVDRTTWGLGIALSLTDHWSIFGEVYGDDVSDPYAQTGLTRAMMDDLIHLDLSVGRQFGSAPDTGFVAVGLNVYSPRSATRSADPFRFPGKSHEPESPPSRQVQHGEQDHCLDDRAVPAARRRDAGRASHAARNAIG
jgi:hypothetical protein